MTTAHEFAAKTITGTDKKLDDYKGQVLLIVNVASKCGLTPQYFGLEALNKEYRDRGLRILGFPANEFGGQEPPFMPLRAPAGSTPVRAKRSSSTSFGRPSHKSA